MVGNPAFAPSDDWILPPLPGSEAEARQVSALWDSRLLIGSNATLKRIRTLLPKVDVAYLATHAIAEPLDPLDQSFLFFADGRLSARSIQEMRLGLVKLAVLSACQSGLGMAHDGGIIGLARAFRIAGVRDVVMSLWSVDDDATAFLMKSFAGRLDELDPPDALRHAMLKGRGKFGDPALWASFVVFGDGAGR